MKRVVRIVGLLVVLLLVAVVSLPFLLNPNQFRPRLEAELTRVLGREVKVGELKLSILSGGVTADDLSVADDPAYSRAPFLHTKSLALGVDLWPLIFSHELSVREVVLDQPQIEILQSAAGDFNFSSLGARRAAHSQPAASTGTPLSLTVKLVKITNGRLTFSQQISHAKSRVLENVNINVHDFSVDTAFPFDLAAKLAGGGDLQLNGAVGPINQTDVAQTPAKVKVKVSGFDLAAAGVESSAGLAGLVSMDGAAAANGQALYVNGRLKVVKLKLSKNGTPAAEPVEFDFEIEHNMRKNSGVLRKGQLHIGSAIAGLTGTYLSHGDLPVVDFNLSGPEMAVPQLVAMLPALGIVLPAGSSLEGGTASAKLSFAGPVEAIVTDGSLGLNNTRLTGFDMGSKMSSIEKLAGIKTGPNTEIQTLAATVHWAPDGSTVQDIKFVAPAVGELSGAGTVSPTQALDFKMRVTMHTGGVALAMIGAKSEAGIPFTIEGTASNPVFRPDVKGIAAQEVHNVASGLLGGLLGKKKK